MQVYTIHPASFLYFPADPTARDFSVFIPFGDQLYKEAVECGMRVCGAIQWHYYKQKDNDFRLDIALPVESFPQDYDGGFHLKRTDQYRCIVAIHLGAWTDLPATYDRVRKFASSNALVLSQCDREVHVTSDFLNPSANVTWVQVGVN